MCGIAGSTQRPRTERTTTQIATAATNRPSLAWRACIREVRMRPTSASRASNTLSLVSCAGVVDGKVMRRPQARW